MILRGARDSVIAIYDISENVQLSSERYLGTIIPGADLGFYNTQIDRRTAPNVRLHKGWNLLHLYGRILSKSRLLISMESPRVNCPNDQVCAQSADLIVKKTPLMEKPVSTASAPPSVPA